VEDFKPVCYKAQAFPSPVVLTVSMLVDSYKYIRSCDLTIAHKSPSPNETHIQNKATFQTTAAANIQPPRDEIWAPPLVGAVGGGATGEEVACISGAATGVSITGDIGGGGAIGEEVACTSVAGGATGEEVACTSGEGAGITGASVSGGGADTGASVLTITGVATGVSVAATAGLGVGGVEAGWAVIWGGMVGAIVGATQKGSSPLLK
jgi:hypothetical protein